MLVVNVKVSKGMVKESLSQHKKRPVGGAFQVTTKQRQNLKSKKSSGFKKGEKNESSWQSKTVKVSVSEKGEGSGRKTRRMQ